MLPPLPALLPPLEKLGAYPPQQGGSSPKASGASMDMLGAGVGGAALAILPFVAGVHFGRRREKKRNIQRSVRGA